MSTVGKLSREEFRRQKDLDAARKAGTAAPEIDVATGKALNPHMPQFMAQAPWYLDTVGGGPSLQHQKKPVVPGQVTKVGLDEWYQRGGPGGSSSSSSKPLATKFRKGACENCGAITHKTRDCLERPRKKGAKWTGRQIAPDELNTQEISGLDKDWDAKRDRWNGYDPAMHRKVVEDYEAIEEARRKMREEEIDKQTSAPAKKEGEGEEEQATGVDGTLSAAKKLAKKGKAAKTKGKEKAEGGEGAAADDDFSSESSADEDEDKYAERAQAVGQKIDTDKRISVRNLRIREDRAKYLYNLNPDSAYYDPKTRSMREAPDASTRPEDAQYAGDNFARASGDTAAMQKLQLFAWQAESRGNDVHLQANPTVNELQYKQFQQAKEKLRDQNRSSILERYGGAEHFDSVPRELREGQTENYVEYSRTGQVVKGQERAKQRSKYEEDALDQNHLAVWGSWYDLKTGQWGYGCCHNTVKGSYCTGKAGIEASQASNVLATAMGSKSVESGSSSEKKMEAIEDKPPASKSSEEKKRRPRSASVDSRSSFSSGSSYSSRSRSRSPPPKRRSGKRSRSASYSDSYSSASEAEDRHKDSSSRRRRRRSSRYSDSEDDSDRDGDRRKSKSRRTAEGFTSRKDMGEGDVSARLDRKKLKEALKAEEKRLAAKAGKGAEGDDAAGKPDWLKEAEEVNKRGGGKRAYNSLKADDATVSEEQLEAYRMKKQVFDDPMANYQDPDAE